MESCFLKTGSVKNYRFSKLTDSTPSYSVSYLLNEVREKEATLTRVS
jgi:hypothetical protein